MFSGNALAAVGLLQVIFYRRSARQLFERGIRYKGFESFYENIGANGVEQIYLCFYGMIGVDGVALILKAIILHR